MAKHYVLLNSERIRVSIYFDHREPRQIKGVTEVNHRTYVI